MWIVIGKSSHIPFDYSYKEYIKEMLPDFSQNSHHNILLLKAPLPRDDDPNAAVVACLAVHCSATRTMRAVGVSNWDTSR